MFYVELRGRTLAIPLPAGASLPDLPEVGIGTEETPAIPGLRVINRELISPGPDASTFAFVKTDSQKNLFRIPLH